MDCRSTARILCVTGWRHARLPGCSEVPVEPTTIAARIAPTGCRDDRPVYTPYNEQQKVFNTYQSSKLPVGNLRGTVANIDVTFQVYDISLLLHLSIELILVYVHKSTTFCQSLIIVYVVLHTDRYILVSRSLLDLDNWPATPRDVAGGHLTVVCTSLLLTSDVLKRAVSSFWLCEVRHFRGPAFSSPCDLVLHFPGLANSRAAIWSVIFMVLQFPVIVFFLWSDIFRSCKFSAPVSIKAVFIWLWQ